MNQYKTGYYHSQRRGGLCGDKYGGWDSADKPRILNQAGYHGKYNPQTAGRIA